MSLLGFVLLTMAIQHPILLWISWPLLASGGLASHMTNMPMARSIPLLSSAFQALTAGFISGGAGVPIIWGMMHKTLNYQIIFVIWLILGSTVTITKIILFSPKRLQKKITETGISRAQSRFVTLLIKGSEIPDKSMNHFRCLLILSHCNAASKRMKTVKTMNLELMTKTNQRQIRYFYFLI